MKKKGVEKEKTYIIECEDRTKKKITVPASWKVTFGPCVKGTNSSTRERTGGAKIPMAIRFYESETQQRAIFTDVISFRDTSIKIMEEKIRVQEKDGYMECEGQRKRTSFSAKVSEWVDPDTHQEQALLPEDTDIFNLKRRDYAEKE